MKRILICDATLREATRLEGNSLSFKEKLEVAKRLNELKVDAIEVGPIQDEKADSVLVRTICSFIKDRTITCVASCDKKEIDKAVEATQNAKQRSLMVVLPVSSALIEYTFHKKPQVMISTFAEVVAYAKSKCDNVEVALDDVTRAESEFVYEVVAKTIEAGASTITLCDTVGVMLPQEFADFIKGIYEKVPTLKDVNLACQCSNQLNMAAACAFASLSCGANIIKTSVTNNVFPALENIANAFSNIGDKHQIYCGLNLTEANRIIKHINQLTTTRKQTSVFDSVIREDGENLTKETSIESLASVIEKRGYDISKEDLQKVYEAFLRVANKKTDVNLKELDVIVATSALQVPSTYVLKSYVINSGNIIASTANIALEKDGKAMLGLSVGDGPIDAAFLAIEQITGHHFELDDFQIQAVTEGKDASGEAIVKLRNKGKLYSGRGISTDIIGASIRAYVNALNKIVYEEK